MNEGTATYVPYRIMTRLQRTSSDFDGNFLEVLTVDPSGFQPDFDERALSGLIPMRSARENCRTSTASYRLPKTRIETGLRTLRDW